MVSWQLKNSQEHEAGREFQFMFNLKTGKLHKYFPLLPGLLPARTEQLLGAQEQHPSHCATEISVCFTTAVLKLLF